MGRRDGDGGRGGEGEALCADTNREVSVSLLHGEHISVVDSAEELVV